MEGNRASSGNSGPRSLQESAGRNVVVLKRLVWILFAIAVTALLAAGGYALRPVQSAAAEHGLGTSAVAPNDPTSTAANTTETSQATSTETSEPPQATTVVPPTAPTTAPPAPTSASASRASGGTGSATCPEGDRQQEVEASLAQLSNYGSVTADGKQSPQDCVAIKKFQTRYGLTADGQAGGMTANVAHRIATSSTAAERAKCAVSGSSLTVCVDLTQQTVWAVRDGAVVWGPTVTRTGKAGFHTPTGTYRIAGRELRSWSVPYKVWMPYWQAFNGGIGFHDTTTPIHDASRGSHGCVNLLPADAKSLWSLTAVGTTVTVFGNRPGT
jgi:lipoprotein-anchoring transpeptidase ErfK/SrfK